MEFFPICQRVKEIWKDFIRGGLKLEIGTGDTSPTLDKGDEEEKEVVECHSFIAIMF